MTDSINQWDANAEQWDKIVGSEGNWFHKYVLYPAIFAILGNVKGLKILDAGCGNGHLSRALARMGAIVTGVDLSKNLIEKAQIYTRNEQLQIDFLHSDISSHLEIDILFDKIISNCVVQDTENVGGMLINLCKLLHPKGQLIITTRHPCFLTSINDLGWELVLENGDILHTGPGLSFLQNYRDTRFQGRYYKIDDYLNPHPFMRDWGGGHSTPLFPRKLEDYFSTISNAGLIITQVLEPLPTLSGEQSWPDMAALLKRIPNFIVFVAEHAVRRQDES